MSEIILGADDFEFDQYGRVVFVNSTKGAELSSILCSSECTTTNGGCQNNGCGNNVSCDEALLGSGDVSLPGMDGTEELIISNNDFKNILEKIKQGKASGTLYFN